MADVQVSERDREAAERALERMAECPNAHEEHRALAEAIAQARAEEREACMHVAVRAVEAAIRARGEK